MPRQLDHYGMDLSGFGDAIRGKQVSTSTAMGPVNYTERLFSKSPEFDKDGNPLPTTAVGRRMLADLALKKVGNKVFNENADSASGRKIVEEDRRLAALGNMQRLVSDAAFNNEQATPAQRALARQLEADINSGVFGSNAQSKVDDNNTKQSANASTRNKASTETPEYFKEKTKIENQGNRIKNFASSYVPVSPGGNLHINSETGNVSEAVTPSSNKVIEHKASLDAKGNIIPGRTEVEQTPIGIRKYIGNDYTPGNILPTPSGLPGIPNPVTGSVNPITGQMGTNAAQFSSSGGVPAGDLMGAKAPAPVDPVSSFLKNLGPNVMRQILPSILGSGLQDGIDSFNPLSSTFKAPRGLGDLINFSPEQKASILQSPELQALKRLVPGLVPTAPQTNDWNSGYAPKNFQRLLGNF